MRHEKTRMSLSIDSLVMVMSCRNIYTFNLSTKILFQLAILRRKSCFLTLQKRTLLEVDGMQENIITAKPLVLTLGFAPSLTPFDS